MTGAKILVVEDDSFLLAMYQTKLNLEQFEVLKNLKSQDMTKDIPVLVLTNYSQKEDIDRCFALGAVDYLIKAHFIPSEVVEKIKKILNKTR